MNTSRIFRAIVALTVFFQLSYPSFAQACDLCAVYSAIESERGTRQTLNIGVAHQFTHYESNVKPEGQEGLPGQHMESNITQLYFDYHLFDTVSLQTNLPFIDRSYRRIVEGVTEYGSESGLGDMALLAKYEAYRSHESDRTLLWELFGGAKLATGDSGRLRETQSEAEEHHALAFFRHGTSGGTLVGGEDLALGSGSYDWIVGSSLFASSSRYFLASSLQYTIRQEGDYEYRYGDDLHWSASPGYYLLLHDAYSLSMAVRLSGEWKQEDVLDGAEVGGSDQHNVFLGPELRYTSGQRWFVLASANFPVDTESAATGVVPRFRALASVGWRFNL